MRRCQMLPESTPAAPVFSGNPASWAFPILPESIAVDSAATTLPEDSGNQRRRPLIEYPLDTGEIWGLGPLTSEIPEDSGIKETSGSGRRTCFSHGRAFSLAQP